ncbi:MAG: HAMP domain-containing histidine kinase [Salibacteraceae bacterium]|nr:HAMP domain-containing histidine kinase [Salibacteraceae bacterium]
MRLMYNLERARITQLEITQLKLNLVEILDKDKDFLNENYLDTEYYKSGHSFYLSDRERSILRLNDRLDSINVHSSLSKTEKYELAEVRSLILDYNNSFRELSKKQLIRGFKDYGIEGKMRSYAHQLETDSELRFKRDVLMLRRHEKDYFLRGDYEYVQKLNMLISDLIIRLDSIGNVRAMAEKELLINYKEAFNDIVTLEREIGLNSSDGLRQELDYYSDWAKLSLAEVVNSISEETQKHQESTATFVLSIAVIGTIISFLAVIILANSISRPVVSITKKMRDFDLEIVNKILPSDFKRKDLSSEMVVMMRAYNNMVHHIKEQVKQIESQNQELGQKNENLNSLNKELDRFAFSVSHDLRSPITSILGLINLVKMENPHLVEAAYLHHIEECVKKLDKFIQNLLFYSKNAQESVITESVDLKQMVANFKSTHLTERIVGLDISFTSDTYPILTDKFRLEIILQNLLSNSIKYRDLNKPMCSVSLYQTKRNGLTTLVIIDNGIGIEAEDLGKVFDLFYRSKFSEDGTGLGLYLVKKSVEKIGGRVNISSEPGKGTRVTLLVPDRIELSVDSNSETSSANLQVIESN